jgi:hypothetical protein
MMVLLSARHEKSLCLRAKQAPTNLRLKTKAFSGTMLMYHEVFDMDLMMLLAFATPPLPSLIFWVRNDL